MTAPGAHAANGFTLLEMLVVIAIMGLVAGLVFPAITQGVAGAEFRAAAAGVEAQVRGAKAAAIRRGLMVPVVIDTGGESIRRAPSGSFRVPKAMQLELPQRGLRFFQDGSSNGGDVVLADGQRSFRLHVDADTGKIVTVK